MNPALNTPSPNSPVNPMRPLKQSAGQQRSTLIHLFPLDNGLAWDAEQAARQCEAEYRQRGYQVSRHQTRQGMPYIKASTGAAA